MLVYSFTYHKMLFDNKFTVFSVHSLIIVFNEYIDILPFDHVPSTFYLIYIYISLCLLSYFFILNLQIEYYTLQLNLLHT